MTVALVDGVPENAAVWDRLAPLLGDDVVRLAPPGFGAPVPEGWGAAVGELVGLDVADRAARLASFGTPPEVATLLAPGIDADTGRCVLGLYRSMTGLPGRAVEPAAARPGLAMVAADDGDVGDAAMRERSAARAGARVAELAADHWWPLPAPEEAAAALHDFWRSRTP